MEIELYEAHAKKIRKSIKDTDIFHTYGEREDDYKHSITLKHLFNNKKLHTAVIKALEGEQREEFQKLTKISLKRIKQYAMTSTFLSDIRDLCYDSCGCFGVYSWKDFNNSYYSINKDRLEDFSGRA